MIDVFEVLDWLNEFSVSNLTPPVSTLVIMSRDVSQSDAQKQAMIRNLRSLARACLNPLEAAEIRLHCAALEYWRGSLPTSIRLATGVMPRYAGDGHREAIARWILGMAQWGNSENNIAYWNWNASRQFLIDSVNAFRNLPPTRGWYEERLKRMETDLATKPEEAYTWLNRYEGSNLSASAQTLRNQIVEEINRRNYPAIDRLCTQLQDITRRSNEIYECAEADVECAFAYYQIGRIAQAIDFLRTAVNRFAPGIGDNHKQVVARWMLGAVEWMGDDPQNREARTHWMRCIDDIEILRQVADRVNDQDRKRWYADRRSILQAALAMFLTV